MCSLFLLEHDHMNRLWEGFRTFGIEGEYITDWVAYVYNRLGNLLHSFASFTPSFECRLHLKPCDICHAKHRVSNVYYIKKHVVHMALKCVLNRKACYTPNFPMCIKSKSMLYTLVPICIKSKSMLYTWL